MLNEKTINIIKSTVYEIIPPSIIEQIIIFGSCARGDDTEDSDTDICIILLSDLDRNRIKSYRYELNKIFAIKYRMPTDIIFKISYEYKRYKDVAGAIEYAIATEGVPL